MRVSNFSLLIPEGKERDSGHVELAHGTVYRIRLMNHCHSRRCDALVTVDGKEIGLFRIERGGNVTLERSADDTGCFTFFRADSDEGKAAGVDTIGTDLRGLIQVTFKPEKVQPPTVLHVDTWQTTPTSYEGCFGSSPAPLKQRCLTSSSLTGQNQNRAAGVTGLTGRSDQTFHTVASLDYDPNEEVRISLRLVCSPAVRPLEPVKKANPVPEPVV